MQPLLTNVRVLDLTSLLPGPFCTLLLADMGAEVIKIERVGVGDGMRVFGRTAASDHSASSAGFQALNRNKHSIALDLKHQNGQRIFKELAQTADVVLEGFRPGVMARLGLDYERLAEDNPGLVYCSLSGYGQDGPLRNRAGHDVNYLALAGVLEITGVAGGQPVLPGVQVADLTGALLAALGIVSALLARPTTGRGRFVDVSMFDGVLSLLAVTAANWLANGQRAERGQMLLTGGYPCYRVYETADGRYMALGALEPKFWMAFCNAVGREDLISLQYAEGLQRQETIEAVAEVFRSKDFAEWQAFVQSFDACCEPILTVDEALKHPHTKARRMVLSTGMPQLGHPTKFGDIPQQADHAAPALGEDSAQLLGELGYARLEVEALIEAGVVGSN